MHELHMPISTCIYSLYRLQERSEAAKARPVHRVGGTEFQPAKEATLECPIAEYRPLRCKGDESERFGD